MGFVRFLKARIPPNFRKEELDDYVKELSKVLEKIYLQIGKIEKGIVSENDLTLESLVHKLATVERGFEDAVEDAKEDEDEQHDEAKKKQSWTEPPVGLNVQRLKGIHSTLCPLNMKKFKDVVYGIICLPSPENYDDPQTRVWLAEVVRKVTFKRSGKVVVES